MTQEDKELLLKDLSARLPYGVVVRIAGEWFFEKGEAHEYTLTVQNDRKLAAFARGELDMKPYLRPMSSMTEEEMEELKTLCSIYIPTDSPNIGFEEYGIVVFTHHLTNNTYSFKLNVDVIDWLNKNMFDYRGLIEMGLVIVVTKENNPYKE